MNSRPHGTIDRARLIRNLQRVVAIKSFGFQEEEMERHMVQVLDEMGAEVTTQRVRENRSNVIGLFRGTNPDDPSFMYNGHMDTNPLGDGWTIDPFGGVVDEHFIYGLGVSNMKAANMAFLEALESLLESGWRPNGDILVAHVIGELQGGIGTHHMLEQGIRADYFLVGEPTDLVLLTMHAGSVELQIVVRGKLRHLSKIEEGINAIEKATSIVKGLDSSLLNPAGLDDDRRGLLRLNVGSIRGGVSEACIDYRPALVPDYCEINLATRVPPGRTDQDVLADLQGYLSSLKDKDPELNCDIHLEEKRRIFMPPFRVSEDEPFIRTVSQVHSRVTGQEARMGSLPPYRYMGTDAGHLSARGMTGVVYGPGGRYNTMPDERVDLKDLFHAAEAYAQVLLALGHLSKRSG